MDTRNSFALNELDKKLYPYLKFRNGFYIEAGANDGITQSNTLFFEKYQNWKGLLIEPIPEVYERCKANRPKAIVENYALVPFDFKESFIEMRFSNLMSLVKGAMKTEEEELNHIAKGCDVQQVHTYEVKVPVATLSSLLEKHHIKKIDLLSLDVEGFELSVLKGIDMKKHAPKYILVEARFREEIDAYLSSWYLPIAQLSHHDILYKKKSFWQNLWN
ncbi:FkbM family methyltransferase [Xanthocytophaga flava]|uniref:FkbM family methyltransferase n=1 Tax=Xanthocytophaga flava TaxID=3048013 RepID=UPI0028D35A61|nr:FkbM family methyltransferase [Xanthocytophaga flavus]MDJ1471635.1 FkbM family methyltransferase [Xanthocytophaga flavus]